MSSPWVVVVTKPSAEEIAERGLRQAGYRVYLPRFRKLLLPHGRTRRQVTSMRPLFSRVVFAQDWRGWPEMSIAGATGLMRSRPSGPARLSDDDVALILQRELSGEFDEIEHARGASRVRSDIKPGEAVEIEAFGAHVLGVLEALTSDGRALVEALLFSGRVRLSVDADAIRRVAGEVMES